MTDKMRTSRTNLFSDERGSTLVTPLVAAAILSIVVFGLSQGVSQTMTAYKQLKEAGEAERLTSFIRNVLSSGEACSKTFKVSMGHSRALPTVAEHFNLTSIVGTDGRVLAEINKIQSGIKITQLEVMPLNNNDLRSRIDASTFIGQIVVSFERAGEGVGTRSTKRSVPVTFEIDATGAHFETCVAGRSLEGQDTVWILTHLPRCADSTLLAGLDSAGQPICEAIPTP